MGLNLTGTQKKLLEAVYATGTYQVRVFQLEAFIFL